MLNTRCGKCSLCDLRASVAVTGNDDAIRFEFERIEQQQLSNQHRAQDLDLEFAYMRFETIAHDIGVTVSDIINAQTKTPSATN